MSDLEVQNYYLLNSKNKNFSDRIDDYRKMLEKVKSINSPVEKKEKSSVTEYYL